MNIVDHIGYERVDMKKVILILFLIATVCISHICFAEEKIGDTSDFVDFYLYKDYERDCIISGDEIVFTATIDNDSDYTYEVVSFIATLDDMKSVCVIFDWKSGTERQLVFRFPLSYSYLNQSEEELLDSVIIEPKFFEIENDTSKYISYSATYPDTPFEVITPSYPDSVVNSMEEAFNSFEVEYQKVLNDIKAIDYVVSNSISNVKSGSPLNTIQTFVETNESINSDLFDLANQNISEITDNSQLNENWAILRDISKLALLYIDNVGLSETEEDVSFHQRMFNIVYNELLKNIVKIEMVEVDDNSDNQVTLSKIRSDSMSDADFIELMIGTYDSMSGGKTIIDDSKIYIFSDEKLLNEGNYYVSDYNGEKCLRLDADEYSINIFVIRDGIVYWNTAYIDENGDLVFWLGDEYMKLEKISDDTTLLKYPSVGMTKEEAINSIWGYPNKINKTTTSYGAHEQWVYSKDRYLYFDNGKLTAIQD